MPTGLSHVPSPALKQGAALQEGEADIVNYVPSL